MVKPKKFSEDSDYIWIPFVAYNAIITLNYVHGVPEMMQKLLADRQLGACIIVEEAEASAILV